MSSDVLTTTLLGDMVPLFDRLGGWKFNQDLTEKYGSVVRLQGLLGVSNVNSHTREIFTYDL